MKEATTSRPGALPAGIGAPSGAQVLPFEGKHPRVHPDAWLAHRMPLFAKGPTVLVVRTGIAPDSLN